MDYLKRNVEESMLQGGVLGSAVLATISWCMSSSTNAMLSTYIVCLVPVLLIIVPDWTHFMRAPGEWADVIFVEPVIGSKQIRRLAWERDTNMLTDGYISRRRSSNSGPFVDFIGSVTS
ncbi:hypothetical protein M758_11G088400 [Ceratodon purpureus]|uniref:Uncharacterized protein n=1 Tax=Ceratodon purpureus TaxID=3225 RepID=A0A8T0GC24_CERPU|nr:hypothetical protein KC19_11G091400 [Ceratodon purpureus]KAG0601159.1 hypothetical protein M758_11G088400 [Ceratodon purpureus]